MGRQLVAQAAEHRPPGLGLLLTQLLQLALQAVDLAAGRLDSRRLFGVMACVMLFLNTLVLLAVSVDLIPGDPTLWIYASIALTGIAAR